MTEHELKLSATYIKSLASFPDAEERISLYLDSLFAFQQPQKDTFNVQKNAEDSVSSKITFSQKEIKNMASTFKKTFMANGLVAHVLKKPSGKNTFCYEIRYRANGYDIRSSSTNLQKAKEKFLAKTVPEEIEKYCTYRRRSSLNLFFEVFEEWCSYKSQISTSSSKALETHKRHFERLPEKIKNMPIKDITTEKIATCLKGISLDNARTYEDFRTLFNMTFKYAIANGYILLNPMALIPFKRAEREKREALSKEEILTFLRRVLEPRFDKIRQRAYFYYFFGLRASELDEESRRVGDFLIVRNRKRKNGLIEYKKIPIPKAAETLIEWNKPLYSFTRLNTAGKLFHELLGEDKSAYNLRHTFATICQQYVRPDIVDIWMGDSPQRLVGKVYTHFPDDFMKQQMDMVVFPTP